MGREKGNDPSKRLQLQERRLPPRKVRPRHGGDRVRVPSGGRRHPLECYLTRPAFPDPSSAQALSLVKGRNWKWLAAPHMSGIVDDIPKKGPWTKLYFCWGIAGLDGEVP